MIVSLGTLQKIRKKEIFVAPCVKEWERLEAEKRMTMGADGQEKE